MHAGDFQRRLLHLLYLCRNVINTRSNRCQSWLKQIVLEENCGFGKGYSAAEEKGLCWQ